MLFNRNLEEIIFNRHNLFQADELVILSGYVGPNPVERLRELPFHTKVIYGMYGSEGIKQNLHNSLLSLRNSISNIDIFYSIAPIHSKCYVWKNRGSIVHALVGSANFSSNGLRTPLREILAETTFDTFDPLNTYLSDILNNSIDCRQGVITSSILPTSRIITPYCRMTLLDPRTNEVQNASGLNWGQNPNNHTNRSDANIPIRSEHIRNYPNLFPPKQNFPQLSDDRGRIQRHNDVIEIVWDDGIIMEGLLEGNYPIEGLIYPKQISSFPEKRILGEYVRRRLGIPIDARVTRRTLEQYGKTYIDVSLLNEGVYYFDFSV